MRHVLLVHKLAGCRIEDRGSELSEERVVLQSATIDEWSAVCQDNHSVAEHIPDDGLRCRRASYRIENSRLVIAVAGHVSRA